MKICIYNRDMRSVLKLCRESLADCGFNFPTGRTETPVVHAVRSAEHPSPLACLSISIRREKYAVTVTIVSSHLSVLFGSFTHNPGDEEKFAERLLEKLRHRDSPGLFTAEPWTELAHTHAIL